jgi:hypothetical protein
MLQQAALCKIISWQERKKSVHQEKPADQPSPLSKPHHGRASATRSSVRQANPASFANSIKARDTPTEVA